MHNIASTSSTFYLDIPYKPEENEEMKRLGNPTNLDGESPRSVPRHFHFKQNVNEECVYWFDPRKGTTDRKSLDIAFSTKIIERPIYQRILSLIQGNGFNFYRSPYGVPLTDMDKRQWECLKCKVDQIEENPLMGIYWLASDLCRYKDDEKKCLEILHDNQTLIEQLRDIGPSSEITIGSILDNGSISYEEKGAQLAWVLLKMGVADVKHLEPQILKTLIQIDSCNTENHLTSKPLWATILDATGLSFFIKA